VLRLAAAGAIELTSRLLTGPATATGPPERVTVASTLVIVT